MDLEAFDDGFVFTSKKHSNKVLESLEEGDDDAIDALIAAEKAARFAATKFTPHFRKHVASDLAALRGIQTTWKAIRRGLKWVEFKRELTTTFAKGKLIIFTEFADTARYFAEKIKKDVEPETLLFSSTSSPELRRAVIANLDANKKEPLDDYRILITTDVLAEGVNLHRSATVKATIRKVKEAFDATDDPVAMITILRKEIARQYLVGAAHNPGKDAPLAPRDVILSSYLP